MNKLKVFKILCLIYFRLGSNEVHSVVVKMRSFWVTLEETILSIKKTTFF